MTPPPITEHQLPTTVEGAIDEVRRCVAELNAAVDRVKAADANLQAIWQIEMAKRQ